MRHRNAALLTLLLCAPRLAARPAGDVPPEWKDRREMSPKAAWDAMEGQPAPSLAALGLWQNTERPLTWDDLRGYVVLIDVWGTWCGPCVKSVPHMVELQERWREQGLVVLGAHSKKGHARMPGFVRARNLPYPVAADTEGSFGAALSVPYYPSYFIVDRDGKMRIAGVAQDKDDRGRPCLDVALAATLAQPWEGERKPLPLRERGAQPPPAGPPAVRAPAAALGSDGWPRITTKKLYAAHDLRGRPAPAFVVEEWLGEAPELEGKTLLIDFWATWCAPCRRAMPELQRYHELFGEDLVVIGISDQHPKALNPGTRRPWGDVVQKLLATQPFTYAQAFDSQRRLYGALGVQGIPHVMVVSSDGIVRWQGFPTSKQDPLTEGVVRAIVEKDRAERARRREEGGTPR